MTYRNILVAVDTTEEADQVLQAAQEFAAGKDTTISIVTVVRPLSDYYSNYYADLALSSRNELETEAVAHATTWLSKMAQRYGIDSDAPNVVVGKPAAEIRRLAEKLGADLIVIGTHGKHGVGLMLGSTANGVLHGAPCSVLAVRVRD